MSDKQPAQAGQYTCQNGDKCKHGSWCSEVYCQELCQFRKPAQVGQVLTDEEIDAAYEKARADYQRSRFAVRGQQLAAQDSPDWWFARAVEAAVLAKRVPMTDAQIDESMRAKFYPARNRAFVDGVEAAERHHGIVGKEGA